MMLENGICFLELSHVVVRYADDGRVFRFLEECRKALDPLRCLSCVVHPVDVDAVCAEQLFLHGPHIRDGTVGRLIHALRCELIREEKAVACTSLEKCAERLLRCADPVCISCVPEGQPMLHGGVKDGAQLILRVRCAECAVVAPCPCAECDLWPFYHSMTSHSCRAAFFLCVVLSVVYHKLSVFGKRDAVV